MWENSTLLFIFVNYFLKEYLCLQGFLQMASDIKLIMENWRVFLKEEPSMEKEPMVFETPNMMSEDLKYHMSHNVGVDRNIFRPGSSRFFKLFREARHLNSVGLYQLNEEEEFLIKDLEIGEFAIYEGELVPLDFPMLEDDSIDEAKYKGRKVKLGAKGAKRTKGGKAYVYVRDPKTKK